MSVKAHRVSKGHQVRFPPKTDGGGGKATEPQNETGANDSATEADVTSPYETPPPPSPRTPCQAFALVVTGNLATDAGYSHEAIYAPSPLRRGICGRAPMSTDEDGAGTVFGSWSLRLDVL